MAKYGTFTNDFLEAVGEATGFFSWPLEGTNAWIRKQLRERNKKVVYNTVRNLNRQGLIKIVQKNSKLFLELTKKGQLHLLIKKAVLKNQAGKWDGQWRLVMFDIPEDHRDKRDIFRVLLKRQGFIKLQASVFIHPWPLSREALSYLKQSGLIKFIRIMRVAEIDDDRELKKKFNLKY